MVIVHVGLDRGTKKSLLVESFESLPVYFGIVSSRKDYFTLTVVSCSFRVQSRCARSAHACAGMLPGIRGKCGSCVYSMAFGFICYVYVV